VFIASYGYERSQRSMQLNSPWSPAVAFDKALLRNQRKTMTPLNHMKMMKSLKKKTTKSPTSSCLHHHPPLPHRTRYPKPELRNRRQVEEYLLRTCVSLASFFSTGRCGGCMKWGCRLSRSELCVQGHRCERDTDHFHRELLRHWSHLAKRKSNNK
jgi:hypothetical protein